MGIVTAGNPRSGQPANIAEPWPTFAPPMFPGCVLWVRADIGATVSGGVVASWTDNSGAGNTFTATSGHRPAYSATGGPSGQPCLVFDGSSSFMTSAASVTGITSNWTQFLVLKIPNTTQSNVILWSTGSNNGWGFDIAAGSRGVLWLGVGAQTFGNNTTVWESWTNWDTAGVNTTCEVNGVATTSSASITPVAGTGGSVIGATGTPGNFAAFSLWEIIVYTRPLLATERAQVDTYIHATTRAW